MSPIERAARALCELDGNPPGATMNGKPLWQDYVPEVRAVLAAVRDPNEAMLDKGVDGGPFNQPSGDSPDYTAMVTDTWRAMIDELLGEAKP